MSNHGNRKPVYNDGESGEIEKGSGRRLESRRRWASRNEGRRYKCCVVDHPREGDQGWYTGVENGRTRRGPWWRVSNQETLRRNLCLSDKPRLGNPLSAHSSAPGSFPYRGVGPSRGVDWGSPTSTSLGGLVDGCTTQISSREDWDGARE